MSTINVQVMQMASHFLYLPFYYAMERKFFGYLPKQYSVEISQPLKNTDAETLKEVLESATSAEPIRFAMCDPLPLLLSDYVPPCRPIVLASLITNSAIWAIDHDCPRANSIEDLRSFQKIITYGEGSTTHAIARRIFSGVPDVTHLIVRPGEEFNALLEHPHALLFSPDIMKATSGMGRGLSIVLPIGSTREYNDVMVTALTTRHDIVEEHPDLTIGLLQAIQRAAIIVRCGQKNVVDFAADRFAQPRREVELALDAANRAMVFPVSIGVGRPQWENSCDAFISSASPEQRKALTDRASEFFTESVEPFSHLSSDAMRREFATLDMPVESTSSRSDTRHVKVWQFAFALVAGLCIGLDGGYRYATGEVGDRQSIIFLASCFAAIAFAYYLDRQNRWSRKKRALLYATCVSVLFSLYHTMFGTENAATLAVGWIMAIAVGVVFFVFQTQDERND